MPAVEPELTQTEVTVRFVKSFNKYQKGDICGFPQRYASQLIQKGVAMELATVTATAAPPRTVRK